MAKIFKNSLLYTLRLLEDYLDDIVLCGGWVPFIYREYVVKNKPAPPLMTKDIDLAAGKKIAVKKNKSIDSIFAYAGFNAVPVDTEFQMSSFEKRKKPPPLVKYEYENKEKGLDIEVGFLTNLSGSGEIRVTRVQGEVTAEALRYMNIILENYMTVNVLDRLEDGSVINLKINIPSPAAYIYQKGLSFVKRLTDYKKGKDLCYIYDFLENYRELHEKMYEEFKIMVKKYPEGWFKRFTGNLEEYFNSPIAEGPILVRQQYKSDMAEDALQRRICSVFKEFTTEIKALHK